MSETLEFNNRTYTIYRTPAHACYQDGTINWEDDRDTLETQGASLMENDNLIVLHQEAPRLVSAVPLVPRTRYLLISGEAIGRGYCIMPGVYPGLGMMYLYSLEDITEQILRINKLKALVS